MAAPVDIVVEYLASFTSGDPETIAGFVSADFRNDHLSALGDGSVGRDEYLRRLPDFLSSFTERGYTVEQAVEQRHSEGSEDGADVIVRYRFGATCDGTRIDIPGVMWFTVERGLIAGRVDVWDSLTFLRQTGQG